LLFPQTFIRQLEKAVSGNPSDLDKAIRTLQSRPSVNLGFREELGDGKFSIRIIVVPSDLNPAFDVQELTGNYTYELSGEIWDGEFSDRATKRPKPPPTPPAPLKPPLLNPYTSTNLPPTQKPATLAEIRRAIPPYGITKQGLLNNFPGMVNRQDYLFALVAKVADKVSWSRANRTFTN
jgi:hypothetical protein